MEQKLDDKIVETIHLLKNLEDEIKVKRNEGNFSLASKIAKQMKLVEYSLNVLISI